MARRPLQPPMEPRGSIERQGADPRVAFVPVPDARRLVVLDWQYGYDVLQQRLEGAIVWLKPPPDESTLRVTLVQLKELGASAVRVLPPSSEDAPLPAEAGSPAPLSNVSEVRPVV